MSDRNPIFFHFSSLLAENRLLIRSNEVFECYFVQTETIFTNSETLLPLFLKYKSVPRSLEMSSTEKPTQPHSEVLTK